MAFADGVLLEVRGEKRAACLDLAGTAARVFRDRGALEAVARRGDDAPEGRVTSVPMAVKLQPGESAVFSWVLWPGCAARDRGTKGSSEDPRMAAVKEAPFDGQRTMFGGFEAILKA
ncbi:MAG: DUF1428 domain-containing protein [Rubrimonas sp.]